MHVIEGEGAVYEPSSRGSRLVSVEVTDETGRPVEGAAVSFHTPIDGPTALFANGLRTEIVQTDVRGRASIKGLQMGSAPGRFLIRIVASKEQARVGALCSQYVSEPKGKAPTAHAKGGAGKWLTVVAVLGGGAAAGYYVAGRSGGSTQAAAAATVSIGTPAVTVGKP